MISVVFAKMEDALWNNVIKEKYGLINSVGLSFNNLCSHRRVAMNVLVNFYLLKIFTKLKRLGHALKIIKDHG